MGCCKKNKRTTAEQINVQYDTRLVSKLHIIISIISIRNEATKNSLLFSVKKMKSPPQERDSVKRKYVFAPDTSLPEVRQSIELPRYDNSAKALATHVALDAIHTSGEIR